MKQFNQQLHDDIALLRTLHAKKDKHEFNVLKAEIMQKHNISKATVYREMKKDTPGEYKIPNYNPPKMDINTLEILMVRELLLTGRQATEIIKIMGRELGIHYYWDRFDSARKMAAELDENIYDPKKSYFPVNGNMFFEKLLGMEYMTADSYKETEINGSTIRISKDSLDMFKVCLMRDNPIEGGIPATKLIIKDIIHYNRMEENINRKLAQITASGEVPSAYALRSLQETKDRIDKKRNLMKQVRDKLLEEPKKWDLK